MKQIYIGFDPREIAAYLVAVISIKRRLTEDIPVYGLDLAALVEKGLYTRPTSIKDGLLHDNISEHPMSTEFAISRFLVPHLAKKGWALFADCDVLARTDLAEVFEFADPQYAVMCVKHNHKPINNKKMDGQVQSIYNRKNWSSVNLWNCEHPSNKHLTVDLINSVPGRDLHGYCWLRPEEIGELPPEYNYLVGASPKLNNPKLVHFTEGVPHIRGYENCEFADEWRTELANAIPSVLTVFGTLPPR